MGIAIVAVTLGCLPLEARADAVSDKRAEAEAIAAKIRDLDGQIERAAEQANGAQLELDGINAQITDAQTQVDAAQQQQTARNNDLRRYAIDAYVHGNPASTPDLGPTDDLTELGQRQGYLASAANLQQQLIDQLHASEQDLQVKVQALNVAKGNAEAKTQQLHDEQAAAQSAVDAQNALYAKAQGELQQLVAEAQAREAERQRAAAQARQEELARQAQQRASARSSSNGGGAADSSSSAGPAVRGGVDAVIAEAKRQLGKPYVWGANGPNSFDCSGLTQWAWRAGGVNLPHYSGAQYSATTHISLSEIRPGDLIFYESPDTHVALYIGNGTIIHAPNSRSVVRYDSIYYWDTAIMASRV